MSIGTNDLFQFFFATSRWDIHGHVSQDVLSPTFLGFIGSIIHKVQQYPVSIQFCGEMAANPFTAMVLLSLGARQLSVSPSSVLRVAKMVNSLPLNLLYSYMQTFCVHPYELGVSTKMQYKNSVDVRNTLQDFVKRNKVEIF
jgi:phosphotransferase system enzyme I (PtsP)